MAQDAFVQQRSIVRRIRGDPDLVLLIFAGSAAEFAVNKAVDWLSFTNSLPQDPIGRLFSTVVYAQRIIFAPQTHIPQLPETSEHWRKDRERHLEHDLANSDFSKRLFEQYRRQLGPWRYQLLLEIQALLLPERVRELLKFRPKRLLIGSCVQA